MKPITAERIFPFVVAAAGLPAPIAEYRFSTERRWRFDFAWPEFHVALEMEGGVWLGGRHVRGSGFLKDMEKYNAAVIAGWRVLRCTPSTLTVAATMDMLGAVLRTKEETCNAPKR